MNPPDLQAWSELRKSKFKSSNIALFISNGFSIRYDPNFGYSNLFKNFLHIQSTENQAIYNIPNTSDFEEILDFLEKSIKLNSLLNLDTTAIQLYITTLKDGLIQTINSFHPEYGKLSIPRMVFDTNRLKEYDAIFTINYDLILYYLIQKVNVQTISAVFPYGKFMDNFSTEAGAGLYFNEDCYEQTNIFHLHGSLHLFEEDYNVYKRSNAGMGESLLWNLQNEIRNGNFPLFVSEGNSEAKERRIVKSDYLRYCLERLKYIDMPMLIYGSGWKDNSDGHIYKALFSNRTRPVIVAIRETNSSHDQNKKVATVYEIANKYKFEMSNLYFVKAGSVFMDKIILPTQ